MLRPAAQNRCLFCEEHPAVRTAQRTLHLVSRAVHCLEGFIEASVVTSVCTMLSSLCEVGPPLVLDDLKLALKVSASVTEGSLLHRTRWLNQLG